jgi:hypothetical protein
VTIGGLMLPPNSLGDGLAYLDRALHEVAPAGYRWITRANRGASCRRARVSCCCSAARWCSSTWCCRRSSTASRPPHRAR